MLVMERSEPNLIPEWLKGAGGSGGGLPQSAIYQDDIGGSFSSRQRGSQQVHVAGSSHGDYDSPRYSTASDRSFLSSGRRSLSSSVSVNERLLSSVDNSSQVRAGFSRSSSSRSYDTPDWFRDGLPGDIDLDWDRDVDGNLRARVKDRVVGFGTRDEKDRERKHPDNGLFRWSSTGMSGKYESKYEADPAPRRSQSMGLSNGPRKSNDLGNLSVATPSASGSLATSMHKAAFEWNFPSLSTDEKKGSLQLHSGNGSVASSRPLWQGSPRPDLVGVSSPGLTIGSTLVSATSSVNIGTSLGADVFSSALTEGPIANGNVMNYGLTANVSSHSMISGTATAAAINTFNMAEALTQNPPRMRMAPQLYIETQRLEELALKQSRQLIPMIPSMPKTMGTADKAKPKVLRTIDTVLPNASTVGQPTAPSQLNSPHRSLGSARPENPRSSQGKLFVLRSSKDGGTSVTSTMRFERSASNQSSSLGNGGLGGPTTSATSVNGSNIGGTGPRNQKQSTDRRTPLSSAASGLTGVDGGTASRARDTSIVSEDKRSSMQAQNRIEFFNALRKKAACNGIVPFVHEKPDSLPKQQTMEMAMKETEVPEEISGSVPQANENGTSHIPVQSHNQPTLELHGNIESKGKHGPANGVMLRDDGSFKKESFSIEGLEVKNVGASFPGGLEDEEAAFLRSLGWDENAEEGEGLTEEEINAFYQMREKTKPINSRRNSRLRDCGLEHHAGSIGSMSSCLISSDSE